MTGSEIEQFLGAPRLVCGTGKAQADATFELLKAWNVESRIVGKVYDTTASNSGWIKGASILLQKSLQKEDMLDFGCHHHVLELILGAAFVQLLGDSKDSKLPIFEKLTSVWEKLDKGAYF